jgi:hypothetical protein
MEHSLLPNAPEKIMMMFDGWTANGLGWNGVDG